MRHFDSKNQLKADNKELALHVKRFSELTTEELYELLKMRQDVFVLEQQCLYADIDGMDKAVSIITESARIYIPMDELVDFEAERERLNKEKEKLQKDIDFVNGKLNNPNFVSKAPEKVVEAQRKALCEYTEKMKLLDESLNKLINK